VRSGIRHNDLLKGGIMQVGGIYTDQKCRVCGSTLRDNHRDGLVCSKHPEQRASRFIVRLGKLSRRFKAYDQAQQALTLLRAEKTRGTFDHREYLVRSPLSVSSQIEKYLEHKAVDLRPNTLRSYRLHAKRVCGFFGDLPISRITYADLEDFKFSLRDLSSKSISLTLKFLQAFLNWCKDRGDLREVPKFPSCRVEMQMRKIITKEQQAQVLSLIYEKHWKTKPRACIGIRLLCTYPNLRPGELLQVQEKHINREEHVIIIEHPKETRNPKFILLSNDEMDEINSLPRGFPEMYFLRHDVGTGGVLPGTRYGKNLLHSIWKDACSELGINGVSLYAGTKHTTISAWAQTHSESVIRSATGHMSDALRRYIVINDEVLQKLYQEARPKV